MKMRTAGAGFVAGFLAICGALVCVGGAGDAIAATGEGEWDERARVEHARPWDWVALRRAPRVWLGEKQPGRLRSLHYEGETYEGRPTRVFAWLGMPAGRGPHPAMVLVHGGGGRAFPEWADHWAARGYAALAMDLSGNGEQGRLADGGPDQSDRVKFRSFGEDDIDQMWTYHAVAAVIRGHSLLRSLPEVDPDRTGLTGISWGGYLTCIVAGIDDRFRVAIPVYGCGFLGENSVWKDGALRAMEPGMRARWLELFDPSRYLAGVSRPILFLNGTTDFAYPMDSHQASYRRVPERWRRVSIVPGLPHGHIWTFDEVDAFVDAELRGGVPLPRLGRTEVTASEAWSRLETRTRVLRAALHYTTDGGEWQKRVWRSSAARVEGGVVTGSLPKERPVVVFLSVTDERGLRVSSEHVEIAF